MEAAGTRKPPLCVYTPNTRALYAGAALNSGKEGESGTLQEILKSFIAFSVRTDITHKAQLGIFICVLMHL